MKVEVCSVSGYKIYPGHGCRYVRIDGKTMIFINRKTKKLGEARKNPRNIKWTILYRRAQKKGLQVESKKEKVKRNTKFERPILGMSVAEILAKRNQKPEVRQAFRDAKTAAIKEAKKTKRQEKLSTKGKPAAAASKPVVAKPVPVKSVGRVGGKR